MRRFWLSMAFLAALAPPALAGEKPPEVRVQRRADGKPVYVLPPQVVKGQVHRPQAFVVLPRPQVGYEWPELERPARPAPTPPAPRRP